VASQRVKAYLTGSERLKAQDASRLMREARCRGATDDRWERAISTVEHLETLLL